MFLLSEFEPICNKDGASTHFPCRPHPGFHESSTANGRMRGPRADVAPSMRRSPSAAAVGGARRRASPRAGSARRNLPESRNRREASGIPALNSPYALVATPPLCGVPAELRFVTKR